MQNPHTSYDHKIRQRQHHPRKRGTQRNRVIVHDQEKSRIHRSSRGPTLQITQLRLPRQSWYRRTARYCTVLLNVDVLSKYPWEIRKVFCSGSRVLLVLEVRGMAFLYVRTWGAVREVRYARAGWCRWGHACICTYTRALVSVRIKYSGRGARTARLT